MGDMAAMCCDEMDAENACAGSDSREMDGVLLKGRRWREVVAVLVEHASQKSPNT